MSIESNATKASKYRAWLRGQRRPGEDLYETAQRVLFRSAWEELHGTRGVGIAIAKELCFNRSTRGATAVYVHREAKNYGLALK